MLAHLVYRTSIPLTLLVMLVLTAGAPISAQPTTGQANVHIATNDSNTVFRSSPMTIIENTQQVKTRNADMQALLSGAIQAADNSAARQGIRPPDEFPQRSAVLPAQLDVIAFESDRNGGFDIFTQEVGGAGPAIPWLVTGGEDVTPEWSPDGSRIVYASDRDGDFDIYVRTMGGQEQQLTNNTAEDAHPSWSPLGDRIIFTSNRSGDYFQIYSMQADGSDVRRIGVISGNHAVFPHYSPNGSRIVFMQASIVTPVCQWNWDVWTMNTSGGDQRRVTTHPVADIYPRWSPDGSQVVFAGCRNYLDFDLYAVNLNTGVERRLTSWFLANEWGGTYSTDSRHIAFSTDVDGNMEIYTMPAGGGSAVNLTRHSAGDGAPNWKPAGLASTPTPTPTRTPTSTPGPVTYTISGRVTDASGHGISGVTVSAGSSSSTTTDGNGYYTFTGLAAGTYNISPSRYLYAFSPPSRTVTVPPDATGQNFVQTPIVDLSVNRIEVAQVFVEQNDPISGTPIPLIAQKDTLVRVYVGVNGAASVGGVSARLHIRQPNGTETVDSRSVNMWPVQAKQTPDPFSLQDTINFRPATRLLQGNVTFWADVDPENRIPETDESNNTGGQTTKTFEAGKPVRIAITQIGYRSFPWGPYAYADWNTIAGADGMLKQVYPVATSDVQYYYQPGDPARVQCLWGNQDACWAEFHNQLKAFWRRVDDEGQWVGGARPHALVGWVPGTARDAGSTCGQAERSSPREVVIADYCDKYMGNPLALTPEPVARVLAHEVGHLLNTKPELQHAKNQPNKDNPQCSAVPDKLDPLYPTPPSYPMGSTFAHGLDMSNANPKVLEPKKTPLATYDLMSYCSPAWISPYNYFKLNTGFTDTAAAQASDAEPDALVRKLLVSGLVFTPTLQVELNPFYVLNTSSAADANSGTGYCLETRNASGVVLDKRCFDLAFVNRETYAPAGVDGFALAIPYPAGTAQIVLTHLGTPIATRPVSAHAPTVRLLSPNGGETWAGTSTQTVTWTASDLDGDTLHFALAYSTDGGASWMPTGSDLTGTQHALDVSMLPGGTSVLLRISATDGVNTTDDVSDAPFTVGRKAPMAFILSPEDGARFFPGQAIWLEGRAFDLEDGALGDAALQWSSDRDGVLGTGKLLIATLSPGEHTITLTAADSDSAQTTTTIRLSVGYRIFLPAVLHSSN